MQENENIYETINEILGQITGDFKVLEEEIDVDLQMEYFEFSRNYVLNKSEHEILRKKEDIFLRKTPEKEKKNRFVELASIDNVEAFRTIERYVKNPKSDDLHDWAVLAYQESRMLIESKLLDQSQIFISTGLGGKGLRLRYFAVFFTTGDEFTPLKERILKQELEYSFAKKKSQIEELEFSDKFATVLGIIPLHVPVKQMFDNIIEECNLLGNFLHSNFLITNVKRYSFDEIQGFLETDSDSNES